MCMVLSSPAKAGDPVIRIGHWFGQQTPRVLDRPVKPGDDSQVLLFYFFGPGTAGNGELSASR
jgi:hypothetical protein